MEKEEQSISWLITLKIVIFYGYDLSQEAIDDAIREAQRMGNSNTFFKVQDILGLNFNEKYDLITAFDAIHDQPDHYSVLRSIYNSLITKEFFLCKIYLHQLH